MITKSKKGPTDDELADRWRSKYPDTIHGLGCFRRYIDGIWLPIKTDQIRQEILPILIEAKREGIRPNNGRINSVIEISKILATVSDNHFDQGADTIVFKNGSLHILTNTVLGTYWRMSSHNKENFATVSLPYNYDSNAEPVNWLKILSRLSPDVIEFLQEFFGYCLTRETKHEIALWLNGLSGSGKSSIIAGIQAMAGPLAIQVSISDIERSRFALPLIVGKNIIYSTEQSTLTPTCVDNLNKIVSGETLMIEEKYERPFNYKACQKIIWASTSLPNIPSGDGFYRRFMIIDLPPLSPDEKNLDIKSLIKQEGPGILNWALEGLRKLERRGHFVIPQSVAAATDQYKATNNIIQEFVESCCEAGANYQIQATPIYTAYCNWCKENNQAYKSIKNLAKDWNDLGFTKKSIDGRNYWVGIKLKPELSLKNDDKKEKYMFN